MICLLNENSTHSDFLFYVDKARKLRSKDQFKFALSEVQPILFITKEDAWKYVRNKYDDMLDYWIEDGDMILDEKTMNELVAEYGKISLIERKQHSSNNLIISNNNTYEDVVMSDEFSDLRDIFNFVMIDEGTAIDARVLHKYLEIKTRFNDWFSKISNDYVENIDYINTNHGMPTDTSERYLKNSNVDINELRKLNIVMKLDMAKEIAMMSKTEKGKRVRKFFIQVDTAAKHGKFSNNKTELSNETISRLLNIQEQFNKRMEVLEDSVLNLTKGIIGITNNKTHKSLLVKQSGPSEYQKESIQSFANELGISYGELCSYLKCWMFVKRGRNGSLLPKISYVKEGLFRIGTNDNDEERIEFTPSGKWKIKEMLGLIVTEIVQESNNSKFDPLNCV